MNVYIAQLCIFTFSCNKLTLRLNVEFKPYVKRRVCVNGILKKSKRQETLMKKKKKIKNNRDRKSLLSE